MVGCLDRPSLSGLAFDDADDLVIVTADAQVLPDGAFGRQQATGAVLSEHRHAGPLLAVARRENASGNQLALHEIEPVRRRAHDPQIERTFPETPFLPHDLDGYGSLDGVKCLPCPPFVLIEQAEHDHAERGTLAVGFLRKRLDRRDDDVCAAELADLFERLLAGTFTHREHRDYAAHAEDHAQHCEKRAQLVQQQGLDAQLDVAIELNHLHADGPSIRSIRPSRICNRRVA